MRLVKINSGGSAIAATAPETTNKNFEVSALFIQRARNTKRLYALFSEGKIISGEEKTQSVIKQKNVFVSYCFS